MKRDLPRRMYRHGLGYRLHHPDGSKVSLGRELRSALVEYHVRMADPQPVLMSASAVQAMWKRHRAGARQRGLAFELTTEQLHQVLDRQGHRCAVTALPFRNDKPPHLRIRPWAPSIDRLDGARGYVAGNVRVVCAFVNVAMNGFGESFFETVLRPLIEASVAARLHEIAAGGSLSIPTDPGKIPTGL